MNLVKAYLNRILNRYHVFLHLPLFFLKKENPPFTSVCIISSTPPTLFHINKSLVFDFLEPTWTFMRRCAENHQVRPKRGLCYYHQLLLTEINCGSPGILPNGWLEGQKTTLHAVVTFRCQEGMTFEGPSYRTICLADGRWSHPLPRCYGKTSALFLSIH